MSKIWTGYTVEDLPRLEKKLKNAKRRATYWSNNPFTGRRTIRRGETSCRRAEKYEIAMCDIDSLCSIIEGITGEKLKRFDPHKEFQAAMTKAFNAVAALPKRAK